MKDTNSFIDSERVEIPTTEEGFRFLFPTASDELIADLVKEAKKKHHGTFTIMSVDHDTFTAE